MPAFRALRPVFSQVEILYGLPRIASKDPEGNDADRFPFQTLP
jgi:hypothetical protein